MRYFLGFMITIGLLILLIFLLFHGGKPKVPVTPKTLDSYSTTDASVSMLIDGPINATSQHQQIHITVDRDNVRYERLQGYDGEVVSAQIFANTESAYDVFLHALAHAGFTKGNTDKELSDEKGYCPLGRRFVFELEQDGDKLERFWATTCGKPKTYLGALDLTISLFEAQVPGFDKLSASFAQ